MTSPRHLPLFDPAARPSSWNERMSPGEFAVHYSHFSDPRRPPFCSVLPDRPAAESFAARHVAQHPAVRCTLFDHRGLVGAPLAEFRGAQFKGESEISARVRRWLGAALFLSGLVLVLYDWQAGFRYSWPATIGTRLLIPGLLLLCTEAALLITARQQARRSVAQADQPRSNT